MKNIVNGKKFIKELPQKEQNNLVNTAFFLHEAADMCLRLVEQQLEVRGNMLHREQKQRFNRMMEAIRTAEKMVEDSSLFYEDAFGGGEKLANNFECIQDQASYYARLALTIGDRCEGAETWEKEDMIMQFVETMPPRGCLSDETIYKLMIKRG